MQIGSKEDRVRNPHIYLTGTLEELVRNNGAEVILEMMMNKKISKSDKIYQATDLKLFKLKDGIIKSHLHYRRS